MTITHANPAPAPVTDGPIAALWAEITGKCQLSCVQHGRRVAVSMPVVRRPAYPNASELGGADRNAPGQRAARNPHYL
jgi:hypothetical protein